MERRIDISPSILFRVVIISLALWFLYVIRDVIAVFLVALILTAALGPIINHLGRMRMPRALAVCVVYILLFVGLGILVSVIMPTITDQFDEFGAQAPELVARFTQLPVLQNVEFDSLGDNLTGSLTNIFSTTAGLFTGLISIVAIIAMSFYMSLQRDGMKSALLIITPSQHQKYVASLVDRIQDSFGRWMAGQLVTMIFVGVLYFIVLWALGVPYALIFAIIGGLLEIVPYFGPVMAAVPAAAIGFLIDPVTGFAVLGGYLAVNMIENYLLVPKIMNRAVGLNPVLIILVLLIGAKIGGLVGVFLAVPVAGAIGVFVKDVLEKKIA